MWRAHLQSVERGTQSLWTTYCGNCYSIAQDGNFLYRYAAKIKSKYFIDPYPSCFEKTNIREYLKRKTLGFKIWKGNDLYFKSMTPKEIDPHSPVYDFHYDEEKFVARFVLCEIMINLHLIFASISSTCASRIPTLLVYDPKDGAFSQLAAFRPEHAVYRMRIHSSLLLTASRMVNDYASGVLKVS